MSKVLKNRGMTWPRVIVLLCVMALFAAFATTASAVHDIGVFQLDGNAKTLNPPAGEDWDLICKAHNATETPTSDGTCVKSPTYTFPSGTTVSSPNSFVVDPSESAQDDILKGGTKDDNDINTWSWTSAKPSPPKNDLTDGFAAGYTCHNGPSPLPPGPCSGTDGDQLLYFGADRFSNSGSANIAFWFFQKKVAQKGTETDGTCTDSSGCGFVGQDGTTAVTHKVGNVSLGGTLGTGCGPNHDPANTCTPGDILVISAFGPKAQIFVFEWVGAGNATRDYLESHGCFTAACSLQPLFIGSTTSDCPEVTGDNACALANDTSSDSPWVLSQKNHTANNFDVTNLFEGGLNLTQLGLGGSCFPSYLINTRASAAGDAELHDKIVGQL